MVWHSFFRTWCRFPQTIWIPSVSDCKRWCLIGNWSWKRLWLLWKWVSRLYFQTASDFRGHFGHTTGTFVHGEFSKDVATIAYLNQIRFTHLECFMSMLYISSQPDMTFLQVDCTHWWGSQAKATVFLWVRLNGWVIKDMCSHVLNDALNIHVVEWSMWSTFGAKGSLFTNSITFTILNQKACLSFEPVRKV